MKPGRPVIVVLTPGGMANARRAAQSVDGDIHARAGIGEADETFTQTGDHLRALFRQNRPIIGLCAAGILIRALAPLLANKRAEPPVLALTEDGASVVPLLGGHHGGNELARRIAAALDGHAAITTAGDTRFGVALDDPPAGWTLANPQDAKALMARCLAGGTLRLEGDAPWLAQSALPFDAGAKDRLVATVKAEPGDENTLLYHPRKLALGLGCERGTDGEEVTALIETVLAGAGLARSAIACVVSIDLKADEEAILQAADWLGVPARFFSAERLEAEAPRLANPSTVVFAEVGCHGVAEGAALAAAGRHGKLVVPKTKSRRTTCAIAQAENLIDTETIGRARGRLAIVGIGPGAKKWLTPEARDLIGTSDVVIGYSYYLDLIDALIAGKTRIDSPLGEEEIRVRRALCLAAEGHAVALVSSGDPGIYAMASLAFECLDAGCLPDGAHRAEIIVAPGISAFQAASARAGAPFGHDFCAISLSDLLTPWPVIEARIQAAAQGDFVIAFYNPASSRRRHQLAKARAILLRHRPADTPVIVARMLGRKGESVTTLRLDEFDPENIDMMTLVVVGSSATRLAKTGGRVYTPRGYAAKRVDK
ncbi:MAG: precorrin-3B C(17)-methyltransferase [Alphaproteobacteria bacterium]|nr:MAG: precorrin-3B C(17)-methyltransferase [Alphaproteobacteria bacterium]